MEKLMNCYHSAFTIQSDQRPIFNDVTERTIETVYASGIKNGILTVFSQHTTCSVLIQEDSDDVNFYGTKLLLQDLIEGLGHIFPTCETEGQYHHPGPRHIEIAEKERDEKASWSLNTDAHLRSVLLGRSVTVPIVDGEVQLGDFGRIYFADFDQVRARSRTVRITVLGV
jgi:secondary thiamine-phosphate synthase enzyme